MQERQQTLIGTLLVFVSIVFLVNAIMDMVRISQAHNFLETKQEEADYFGVTARWEALKYTPLVYMNWLRVVTNVVLTVSVLLTWSNNCILDMYLVSNPIAAVTFAVSISITFYHI